MNDSTLWQKLTSEDNLYSAWLKVAGNMGAGGVDRVSIEDFQLNLYSVFEANLTKFPLKYLTFIGYYGILKR